MKNITVLILIAAISFGQTGIEIAIMVDEKPTPKDISNKIKMVLTNSKGKSRTNVMISKSIGNLSLIHT